MRAIRYDLHFSALLVATSVLWFDSVIDLPIPYGTDRFVFFFALVGGLHATSLVISLRHSKALASKIAFVGLAIVLSVAAPCWRW